MAWQPDSTALTQLLDALGKTQSPDNAVQSQVRQFLASFSAHADYERYLAFIFATSTTTPFIRNIAGLLLKTNLAKVDNHTRLTTESVGYVKEAAFVAVQDQTREVQRTAGVVLTTIVSVDILQANDILGRLAMLVSQGNPSVVEGSFTAIRNICEDSAEKLDDNLLRSVIPLLIKHFDHQIPEVRSLSIAAANHFVLAKPTIIQQHLPAYISGLYRRATDDDVKVRKNVCQGIVMTLEGHAEALMPEMSNVISFMLKCTEDSDTSVALEACEFWLAFAEHNAFLDTLEPYMGELIRILLKGMIYSPDEIMNMGADAEDAHVADRAEDIKPHIHRNKVHGNKLTEEEKRQLRAQNPNAPQEDEDDYDDDDEDDDDDVNGGEWTLRKCSAAALDVMSTLIGNDILQYLLQHLTTLLRSEDWKELECGILALGAVAEGCGRGMEPHLNHLVRFMVQCLSHPKPLVRSITCWTLGRYSHWIVYGPQNGNIESNHSEQYFQPVLDGLLQMVLSNSKKVQEAGCSALATLEEEACEHLVPFLGHILTALQHAFKMYQNKNLLILYDAVGTLADSVGLSLNNPQYIPILLSPLIEKWQEIYDDSRDIFPLLECLSSVAIALGPGFKDLAGPVWERCVGIVKATLMKKQQFEAANRQGEEPDMDFVIVSLDLMSGIAQGLNTDVGPLVAKTQPPITDILSHCMQDPSADVRQSAYALLGDLAISAFDHIRPSIPAIMNMIIYQIDQKHDLTQLSVCNNATWAAGEIALQLGGDMGNFVPQLLPRLVDILANGDDVGRGRTLVENAAITIGRLSSVAPAQIAVHLDGFFLNWCKALRTIRDNVEKETAFFGLCRITATAPAITAKYLVFFCDAVVSWQQPSATLNQELATTLQSLRQMIGDAWPAQVRTFPVHIQEKLRVRYEL